MEVEVEVEVGSEEEKEMLEGWESQSGKKPEKRHTMPALESADMAPKTDKEYKSM